MTAEAHWNWLPSRQEGIWRHGCAWTRPLFAAAPWVTLALLLALFALIGDRLPEVPGTVCDLPPPGAGQADAADLAALVLPGGRDGRETLVFFDDARYSLSDAASAASLKERIAARAAGTRSRAFLLLADRRVPSGDVMRLSGFVREAGLSRVQIAERRE